MNEAVQTLDGWYSLHLYYSIDRTKLHKISTEQRGILLDEFKQFLNTWELTEERKEGSHSVRSVVGQKADFLIWILRPTMADIHRAELEFNKLLIHEYLIPTYSFVSIIELSNYLPADQDPYQNQQILARLYPTLPKTEYLCFYPMNKKRDGDDNWYMLPMDERRVLMASHGKTGRKYAGLVTQIVTGSVGLDDWEWGVTLLSDDPLQFKKLVYEMRFDEVSARYGEFGEFYIAQLLDEPSLNQLFLY